MISTKKQIQISAVEIANFWLHEQSVIKYWVFISYKKSSQIRPSNYWDVALPP